MQHVPMIGSFAACPPCEAASAMFIGEPSILAWNRFGQSIVSQVALDFGDSNFGRHSIRAVNASACEAEDSSEPPMLHSLLRLCLRRLVVYAKEATFIGYRKQMLQYSPIARASECLISKAALLPKLLLAKKSRFVTTSLVVFLACLVYRSYSLA